MDEIIWYFDSAPAQQRKFQYQTGEWGPIASMTDERYYIGGGDEFWLWQKPEGHCEVCETFDGWHDSVNWQVEESESEEEQGFVDNGAGEITFSETSLPAGPGAPFDPSMGGGEVTVIGGGEPVMIPDGMSGEVTVVQGPPVATGGEVVIGGGEPVIMDGGFSSGGGEVVVTEGEPMVIDNSGFSSGGSSEVVITQGEPVMIDGGFSSGGGSVVMDGGSSMIMGEPTVTTTTTTEMVCMDMDGNVVPCDQIPQGAVMMDGGSTTSTETSSSSGSFEMTIDENGNPVMSSGGQIYENFDPNDPSTWPVDPSAM